MTLSSYAFDLHLQSTDMISIITSIASRSVAPLHGCSSSLATITTTWNKAITRWIDTQVLTELKTTIRLLPVAILQQGSLHTSNIITITWWPYHITKPLQKQVRRLRFSLQVLRGLGLSNKNGSYLRNWTTTLIQVLSSAKCRFDLYYDGRDRHPQSHLCNTSCTSTVEQVSCAMTCKVSPSRFIPPYRKMQSTQSKRRHEHQRPQNHCVLLVQQIYA